jgi:DNA-binding MarR family transcriptional regulator
VSRGLGSLQRGVCETLAAAEGHELALRELRRRLGEPDRSNLRRAIRGLLKRGLVEESCSGGERRLGLAFWGLVEIRTPPEGPSRRRVSARMREELRALREAREEERRRMEAEAAKGPRWLGYEHRFVRNRRPGPAQERILYVLWEYTDPLDEGLPVSTVKAIVGGDRSNTRRAIRTLLLRGELDESEDGERIRLSYSTAFKFSLLFPPFLEDPIDDQRARMIVRAHKGGDRPR